VGVYAIMQLCSRPRSGWPARRPRQSAVRTLLRGAACARERPNTGASASLSAAPRARACAVASASCARLRPSAARARSACVRASARRSRPSSASAAAAARSSPTRSARMFSAASAARSRSRAPASAPAPAATPAARAWPGAQAAQGVSAKVWARAPGPCVLGRRRPRLHPPRAPDIMRRRLTQPAEAQEGMCAATRPCSSSCCRGLIAVPIVSGVTKT